MIRFVKQHQGITPPIMRRFVELGTGIAGKSLYGWTAVPVLLSDIAIPSEGNSKAWAVALPIRAVVDAWRLISSLWRIQKIICTAVCIVIFPLASRSLKI